MSMLPLFVDRRPSQIAATMLSSGTDLKAEFKPAIHTKATDLAACGIEPNSAVAVHRRSKTIPFQQSEPTDQAV
jgi:hypothetical protein